jgi:hypothetical protein
MHTRSRWENYVLVLAFPLAPQFYTMTQKITLESLQTFINIPYLVDAVNMHFFTLSDHFPEQFHSAFQVKIF